MSVKKNKSTLVIRGAKSWKEHEVMVENAAEAFSTYNIGRDPFYYMSRFSPGYRLEDTRLGILDGEIIGSVNIFRRRINVRGALVPTGGIADVHILKEYRGSGFGLRILENAIDYMKSQGMPVSILFSDKRRYYEKLGWKQVYRPRYVLDGDRGDFLVPARYRVEKTELNEALEFLRTACGMEKEYHGQVHRDAAYWKSLGKWAFVREPSCYLAYEKDKKVAVCLSGARRGNIWIHECRHLPGHDESPKNLLLAALREAKEKGLRAVVGMLPETHPLAIKTVLLGGRREIETELMGLVHDPIALMKTVMPAVLKKSEIADKEKTAFSMKISGYGTIEILVEKGNLSGIRAGKGKPDIEMDPSEFINMILGTAGIDNGAGKGSLLKNLFPPEEYVFWQIDKF